MNDLQIFENPEFGKIRTLEVEGEPWFVGKDVAEILGYTNPRKALDDHIDLEDKMQGDGVTIRDAIGREQHPTIISESGLYSLIFSSKLPTAKKFKRWVTSEVIPSIRKHGAYLTPSKIEEVLLNPDTIIQLATALKEEQAAHREAQAKIAADRPKVLFADAVSTAKTSILVGELAKLLKQNGVNMGQNRLFAWMRENGYLIKRQGTDYNMPTQKSMEMGLFEIKETAITHSDGHTSVSKTSKITGAGQQYFITLFLGEQAS